MQADVEVDLSVVASEDGDGGVPNGRLLTAFVDATLSFDTAATAEAGAELAQAIGSDGLVDAAAVTAMFQLNTRAADAVGIPIEERSLEGRAAIGNMLGFEDRAGGIAP